MRDLSWIFWGVMIFVVCAAIASALFGSAPHHPDDME